MATVPNPKAPSFPCPVCTQPLDVRQSKKGKPYVVCAPCGIQMFVRESAGIRAFDRLVSGAAEKDLWKRLAAIEERYRVQCPECDDYFWIEPRLAKTSWVDGKLEGFNCPDKDCEGVAEWKDHKAKRG
jgi:ssDNA-binding Zn-finger/Zn-ribbon topoisomerase 1